MNVGLFDNTKFAVKMDGDQYVRYLRYKEFSKKPLTNEQKKLTIVLLGGITALFLIMFGIQLITYSPPVHQTPFFEGLASISWLGILKFLAICVGIAWIVHGVALRVLA